MTDRNNRPALPDRESHRLALECDVHLYRFADGIDIDALHRELSERCAAQPDGNWRNSEAPGATCFLWGPQRVLALIVGSCGADAGSLPDLFEVYLRTRFAENRQWWVVRHPSEHVRSVAEHLAGLDAR